MATVRFNEVAEQKIIPPKEDGYKPPSAAAINAARVLANSIAGRKGLPIVKPPVTDSSPTPDGEKAPYSPTTTSVSEVEDDEEEAVLGSQPPHSPSPHQSPLPYSHKQRWLDEDEEEEQRHGGFRDRPF